MRERPRRRRHLDHQLQSPWLDSSHVGHCRRDFAEGSEADPSNADEHLDRVTNSRNHALVNRRSVLYKGDLADAVLAASRQEAASPLSRLLGADPPPGGTRPRKRNLPRTVRARPLGYWQPEPCSGRAGRRPIPQFHLPRVGVAGMAEVGASLDRCTALIPCAGYAAINCRRAIANLPRQCPAAKCGRSLLRWASSRLGVYSPRSFPGWHGLF